ncbi:hypothetical protein B842_09580 [Corynebacterium humireducens NBRC 106098 = DSM 45392]|uniref:Aminoglycoside phosphotransferase domain-containing protein n=1 Tax=Corynebacterium humireducens NBRC 106098 = DSM 45392 TaxID=1223515 RepID=A0A0B5D454_9CORY|nr:hypothetical protein [Corynebacterium humireducens]AJE33765.1 hypothetical protein B842_09580 [Corynebacterium humireducens NBRC 106098 = DSM 45392]
MGETFDRRYSEPWILHGSLPSPEELTTVISSEVPGAVHTLMTSGEPGDDSLHQFVLHPEGHELDLEELATEFCRSIRRGVPFGLGTFHGTLPTEVVSTRIVSEPHRISLFCADAEGTDRFVFTLYRRVWPGIPNEVEVLSTLTDSYSPGLTGHLELELDGLVYVLGTARRVPTGINAFEYAKMGVAAQVFSHSQGLTLGQTLRFIHDSLIMSFPYEWAPAAEVARDLESRLDGFLERTPVLAEHAPWIRDWYRNLRGEVFCQRLHGNMSFQRIWLEDDESWFIGGWEGDLRLPLEERTVFGSPLSDFAMLQRSLFWACEDNKPWCMKTMSAVFEGYGEPMTTRLFCAYVLDRACEELADHSGTPDGQPEIPLGFFTWFRDVLLPTRDTMELSQFHREVTA